MSSVWSSPAANVFKLACTTANESAPTLVTEGAPLGLFKSGFSVFAAADSGQTWTASPGGVLQAYIWNDTAQAWGRAPDLDVSISVASARYQAWAGFGPAALRGRVAYVPVSVTVSSGGITVYITGT